MHSIVIFAAVLLCVGAVQVPYIRVIDLSSESSEEVYLLQDGLGGLEPLNLNNLGVVPQPVLSAVEVKGLQPKIQPLPQVRVARAVPAVTSNEVPLKTTTVPDVIKTSTTTTTPRVQRMVGTMKPATMPMMPVKSTDPVLPSVPLVPTMPTPTVGVSSVSKTAPEVPPSIPLSGVTTLLPVEVSRVPLVPRMPVVPATVVPTAATVVKTRPARAIPFFMTLTKVTPVPPMPRLDVRAPKMSDITRPRMRRATVKDVVVQPVAAVVVEEKPDIVKNCDMECTKLDLNPVCAFNGDCYHEFANQCVMDTFICKRPDLGFKATLRERCAIHWVNRCSQEDLKQL